MSGLFFYQKLKNNKRASILVACLWIVMILSLLGMSLGGLIFQLTGFSRSYQRLTVSLPMAKAAIKTIFFLREKDSTPVFDTLGELTEEKSVNLCEGNFYKYFLADKLEDKIVDEGAMVNLNTAPLEVLERLPEMAPFADKIVNSGLRPFSSINELFLIDGVSKESFIQFKDFITVYGTGKININTARREVLLALGLDEELVNLILRAQKELKIQNQDGSGEDSGYGFSSTAGILDGLRSMSGLSLVQEQTLLSVLPTLDVKSEYLRLNVLAFPSGKPGLRYSIVIYPAMKKILSWNEF